VVTTLAGILLLVAFAFAFSAIGAVIGMTLVFLTLGVRQ
jgi:uncharacterized protein involved in cysteine biosynthesis